MHIFTMHFQGAHAFAHGQAKLNNCKDIDMSLVKLDDFAKLVLIGRGHCLPADFFATRVLLKKQPSIKAFADETLAAMQVLLVLCEFVLMPSGILPEHVRCLLFACELLEYFTIGDEVSEYNDRMRVIAREHHVLFLVLYDVQYIKPKLHYLYHAIKPQNMNTLAPERLHKAHKGHAEHAIDRKSVV